MLLPSKRAEPFAPGVSPPERWPFSPSVFRADFQHHPWYAFEDWSPEDADVVALVGSVMRPAAYRIAWATRDPVYEIVAPTTSHAEGILLNMFRYDGNVVWSECGLVVVNYFSDFLMTNLPDEAAAAVFGEPLPRIWEASITCFTDPDRLQEPEARAIVHGFVQELKATWSKGSGA